jgi:hypothetical protein
MISCTFMYTHVTECLHVCAVHSNTDVGSDIVTRGADPEVIYNYVIKIML